MTNAKPAAVGRHFGVVFVLLFALLMSAALASAAWGYHGTNTSRDALERTLGEFQLPQEHTLYVDDDSGIELYEAGIRLFDPKDLGISSIDVFNGEECLHAKGSCSACDALRAMNSDGHLDMICRAEISNSVSISSDNLRLSIPTDAKLHGYTTYQCSDDGSIVVSETDYTAKDIESISIIGNEESLRHPFGVVFNLDTPNTDPSQAKSKQKSILPFVLEAGILMVVTS